MDIDLLLIIGIILGILAFAAGWRIASNVRNKKTTQDIERVPYLGPVLDYRKWWPKDGKGWNVILNKLLTVGYTFLAVWIPFMWVFVAISVVYDFNWMER